MAGDRGLAFAMIGLIGSTMVWLGQNRTHAPHPRPAITASATPAKICPVKTAVYDAPSHSAVGTFEAEGATPLITPLD